MRRSLLLVALLSVALIGGATHSAGAAGTAPTFNQNLLLPNSGSAAEPSIRVDSHGTPFVIAPTGVPAGCKAWRVAHDGSSAAFLGFPDSTLGGGDCDWAIGPQEAGVAGATGDDLAYSSLSLANITTGKSDDSGATFTPPNVFSQQVAGDDRMWMAADPQLNSRGLGTIYMTYHDVSAGEIELGVSTDGGTTYAQNSPVINPLDVPLEQWTSASGAGNELGNIVARRDASGLTLYTIFETPDSATDSAAQLRAQTSNFNRVYEAVGTVTGAGSATPVVTWHDYEIFHGPVGARLNRIFPVTAVDAAGHVYAIWTDGNHVYFKSDSDGTHWDPAVAPTTLDAPGHNTALMPWAVAGGNGMVDVVWYAASGGAGAQPAPNDDPNNKWVVWMAQTLDGGSTWTSAQASDHVIHTGSICIDGLSCDTSTPARDRTLLDFFQVDVDPTTGAANIAYADDHASPGNAVVYFTRQCTGDSATTGAALTNDCTTPAPPAALPQGTTCPGPQVVDASGDAPNSYPGGDGSNIDTLDVTAASLAPGAAGQLDVTLTLKDLNGPPPPANLPAGLWRVGWTFGGTTYAVEADSNGGAANTFSVGTVDSSQNYNPTGSVDGSYNAGPNGTIVWHVPLADVGNPSASAMLTSPWAETHGAIEAAGTGVFYTAPADRAPNSGFGSPANVGGCTSGTTSGGGTTTTATTPTTTGGGTTSGGGSSGGGGGAAPATTTTTTTTPPSTVPTPAPPPARVGGVAGTKKVHVRSVRGHGLVGSGRLGSATFTIAAKTLTYVDRTHHLVLRAAIGSVRFGSISARITGIAKLNGKRVRFAAVAVDHGKTGDVFRIDWNRGRSRGGLVRKGGITVT